METQEILEKAQHTLDKEKKRADWGDGEWVEEPDYALFEHCGFQCEVQRAFILDGDFLRLGYLSGYITIPIKHPWKEKEKAKEECVVHQGVTFHRLFGDECKMGFDCAQLWDVIPSMKHILKKNKETYDLEPFFSRIKEFAPSYKTFPFCIEECKIMAEQAKAVSRNDH